MPPPVIVTAPNLRMNKSAGMQIRYKSVFCSQEVVKKYTKKNKHSSHLVKWPVLTLRENKRVINHIKSTVDSKTIS